MAVAASVDAPCAWVFSTSTAVLASAVAAAISAAGGDGAGGGPGSGATVGAGPGGAGRGGGVNGNGAEIILAQAAVIAAALIMPAPCCRLTALCIAMPKVSSITASSMPNACAGAWPVVSVTTLLTASTIWLFTVLSSIMAKSLLSG